MIRKLSWSIRFAISELKSERLFGLGVALSVCSVLTPTALLWGTKSGMIETMRTRLLTDPAILEITGQENSSIEREWFSQMRKNPAVSFVMPSVRRISLYGNVSNEASPERVSEVAYLPTATGDPVGGGLEWTPAIDGKAIPCSVTSLVAEELGITQGSKISIEQRRFEDGKSVKGIFQGEVMKVLKPHESNSKAVFLPLTVIERIEDFKDGYAIPTMAWNKQVTNPLHVYDSLALRFSNKESRVAGMSSLEKNTTSMKISVVDTGQDNEIEIRPEADGLDMMEIMSILELLEPLEPSLNPRAECSARYAASSSAAIILRSSRESWMSRAEFVELHKPSHHVSTGYNLAKFEISSVGGNFSEIAIAIGMESTGKPAIEIPSHLAGILGGAKRRIVEFNQNTGEFRPLRQMYPGFRLYAKKLEDVRELRLRCEEQGILAKSNEDRINSVLTLDAALGKFLLFIVIAGGVGGAGALFTSLYLSIERSRRQFAVFQILGIPRLNVFSAVLVQAVIMVSFGCLLSFLLFQIGKNLLATIIGEDSQVTEEVCRLGLSQWLVLLVVTLILAIISGLLALSRLRFKDPAIVARSE
jgi:hypothetical protein